MPELPEVETIARGLDTQIKGCIVSEVIVREARSVDGPPDLFVRALTGRTIHRVRRRGKLLLVELNDNAVLAVHLKMTGRLFVPLANAAADAHVRVLFMLRSSRGDPLSLLFHDVRKFGYCRAINKDALEHWPFYARLGPEPLEIDADGFAARVGGRRARIKALLLNQTVLAGIGNIYADEALFRARIHPETPGSELCARRLAALHRAMSAVLNEAIASCGSSIRDYRDAQGHVGSFQNSFRVYGRAGQPCVACATPLQRIRVSGRSSTFCPCCQSRSGVTPP